jgi:hypothetical protein
MSTPGGLNVTILRFRSVRISARAFRQFVKRSQVATTGQLNMNANVAIAVVRNQRPW